MRRLCISMVLAAATALVPAWAVAGNQEVAEQIAASLRESGQLHGYKIGVKFQDGTAWLRGRVSSREQMNRALKLVLQTRGVSRVVNNLQIGVDGGVAPAAGYPTSHARPNRQVASRGVQPLQQAAGAFAPEQLPRGVAADLTATTSRHVPTLSQAASKLQQVVANEFKKVQESASPKRSGVVEPPVTPTAQRSATKAERVATSFTTVPAKQTTATAVEREPTTAAKPARRSPSAIDQDAQRHISEVAERLRHSVEAPPLAVARTPARPAAPMPGRPIPVAYVQGGAPLPMGQPNGAPVPQYVTPATAGVAPARYDQPHVPNHSWPSYAAHPNYAGLTYPKQYSPTAWPYIGPFYPYPQVPLGWRKVTLEWHDGWWQLDFDSGPRKNFISSLFRANQ